MTSASPQRILTAHSGVDRMFQPQHKMFFSKFSVIILGVFVIYGVNTTHIFGFVCWSITSGKKKLKSCPGRGWWMRSRMFMCQP